MTYNFVFKELVKDRDDVRGALAYVLYKNEKVEYIENYAKQHGSDPTDAEMEEFRRMTSLPGRLEAYKNQADDLLENFLDNVLATELIEYQQKIKEEAIVKAVTPGFWNGVLQNVVAGLVATLMTFGFVMAVWMYNEGPSKIMQNGLQKYLGSDTTEVKP